MSDDNEEDYLNIRYDETTKEWVAEFESVTSDGTRMPRAIICKTQEQLIKQVGRVIAAKYKYKTIE